MPRENRISGAERNWAPGTISSNGTNLRESRHGWSDEQYRELTEVLQIRELAVDGIVYVTTLMDAKKYRRHELAEPYAQRWTVELDLRSIKTNLMQSNADPSLTPC